MLGKVVLRVILEARQETKIMKSHAFNFALNSLLILTNLVVIKGEMYLNDISKDERILILDDVLSTGGTMRSVIDGVKRAGATVTQVITVIEKGPGLAILQEEMPDIKFDSLIKVEMDGSNITILD